MDCTPCILLVLYFTNPPEHYETYVGVFSGDASTNSMHLQNLQGLAALANATNNPGMAALGQSLLVVFNSL